MTDDPHPESGMYCIWDSEMNAVVEALKLYINNTSAVDVGEAGDLMRRLREAQQELKEMGRL